MTLFSILLQILFSPLASPGAPIYAEVLLQIFAETRRHQQPLSRELALTLVHEVLAEPHNTLEMTDDAGDGDTIVEGVDPLTARAGAVLRYLMRCGWLRIETQSDFSQSYTLPDYAFRLLNVFNEIASNEPLPLQGLWTVQQYLTLTNQTNQLIEFTDGVIEVLPIPTKSHQMISKFLFLALLAIVQRIGGDVFYAPLRVQVRPGKFREPDLLLVLDRNDLRAQDAFWLGADLVMEIVSPDRPERDTEEKPHDYAEAGILEYWIVNPLDETITLLTLRGDAYAAHGIYRRGERVASLILDGFSVGVDEVFAVR